MNYVMVSFARDWADEFDVKGTKFFTKEEWNREFALFNSENNDIAVCIYFGTNEGWEDENFGSFKNNYYVTPIFETTYLELHTHEFGTFFSPSDIFNTQWLDDEEGAEE